jgi:hypothetical protein
MLDRLDVEAMKLRYRPEKLTCYDEDAVTGWPTPPTARPSIAWPIA